MKKINVLSLFGGLECGRVAMDRLGWNIGTYYSSEFDPYPRSQTEKNFPDIIHLGDVKKVIYEDGKIHWDDGEYLQWSRNEIDILIGGSPCTDLSAAKANGKGLEGEQSKLFYEYVRILKESKPKYFMLENVASMKKSDKEEILRCLREVVPETEAYMINSALVSAQNRKRLYFTNIPGITQPEDRKIFLRDILENIPFDDPRWKELDEKYITDKLKLQRDKAYSLTATYAGACPRDYLEKSSRELVIGQFRRGSNLRIHADQENSPTLTANMGTGGNNVPVIISKDKSLTINANYAKASQANLKKDGHEIILGLAHRNRGEGKEPECNGTEKANSLTTVMSDSEVLAYEEPKYYWRKLTCKECERLQTLPDDFTKDLSNSRRYKAIGNGWTVAVIEHIFSFAEF